jgi:hypothetical protein
MNPGPTLEQFDFARDEALTDEEVRRLRSSLGARPQNRLATRAIASLFLLLLIAVAAMLVSRHHSDRVASVPPPRPAHTRQLQLTTPGGTRVVWIFNDKFSM